LHGNKSQVLILIALVLLGFIAAGVAHWLGVGRPWIYVIAAAITAVAVYLVMRDPRNQV